MSAARLPLAASGILTTRIGRRFVTLFIVCALLPLVVFAWLAVTRTTDQLRRERLAALHNGAKTAGMGIAARLTQAVGDLAFARHLVERPDGDRDGEALEALRLHVGERCSSLWVVDGGRERLLFGDRTVTLPPQRRGDREHLATGKMLMHFVGKPIQLVLQGLVDPQRPDGPMLVSRVRTEWFWDPEEAKSEGCEVAVFDSDWRTLFHTFAAVPDGRSFADVAMQQPSSGTVEWAPAGELHLARYWRAFLQPQYGCDFFVVMTSPQAEAFKVSGEFTWWFMTTAVCTLLLVLLASLVQMRRTLDPIVSLHDATRRVAAGHLDASVRIESDDEFGELGVAFNHMTSQLQENIRRREQTERELVASRDAALAAARAKDEFVTNVSHEFRTPMTEILSAAEILTQLREGDDDAREEFSGIALRGAQRLARLVDDVLALGADDVWAMGPVDVPATVAAAVARLPDGERGRVTVVAAPGLPTVAGNADRLAETWARLLDNAVKFSDAGTPIEVRVQADSTQLVVEIADRGTGIAAADLHRIFEPFCQVGRDQLTNKAHGTGLGLTLARHAVARHGGRIDVHSELGVGSTFRVSLPVRVARAAAMA